MINNIIQRLSGNWKFRLIVFILVAVLALQLGISFFILKESQIIRVYDENDKLEETIELYEFLKTPLQSWSISCVATRIGSFVEKARTLRSSGYPRVVPVVQAIALVVFENIDVAVLTTNFFFLIIMIFSVFGIGALIYDRFTGFLAAILVLFSPAIFSHSRLALLDLPLTAMVSFAALMLLRALQRPSIANSIVAGVAVGLAQLTKQTAIVFLVPIIFAWILLALIRAPDKKRTYLSFFLIITTASLVAGYVYFYYKNFVCWQSHMGKSFYINHNNGLWYYPSCCVQFYIGLFPFLIALPFFICGLFRKEKKRIFLIVWVIVSAILFSFSPNVTARYLMPIVPALFIIIASGICCLRRPLRLVVAVLAVGVFFFQYLVLNIQGDYPDFFRRGSGRMFTFIYSGKDYYCSSFELGHLSIIYHPEYELARKITDFLAQKKSSSPVFQTVSFTFNTDIIDFVNITCIWRKLPYRINRSNRCDAFDFLNTKGHIDRYFSESTYMIHRTGLSEDIDEPVSARYRILLEEKIKDFSPVKSFVLDKDRQVIIYQRKDAQEL